jgi:hypothetical protein
MLKDGSVKNESQETSLDRDTTSTPEHTTVESAAVKPRASICLSMTGQGFLPVYQHLGLKWCWTYVIHHVLWQSANSIALD